MGGRASTPQLQEGGRRWEEDPELHCGCLERPSQQALRREQSCAGLLFTGPAGVPRDGSQACGGLTRRTEQGLTSGHTPSRAIQGCPPPGLLAGDTQKPLGSECA